MLTILKRLMLAVGPSEPDIAGTYPTGYRAPFMELPPEIVVYISQYLSKHEREGDQTTTSPNANDRVANSDLTSLASSSSSVRHVLLPGLFSDIIVDSSSRLTSLAQAPKHILELIRNLECRLDLEFYEAWNWSLDYRPATSGCSPRRGSSDALNGLSHILLTTSPNVRRFAFTMRTRKGSFGSAWSQFPRPGMVGMPFAGPVVDTMNKLAKSNSDHPILFPELQQLSLDATADIQPFLSLTPNLASLQLRIPEGFRATECRRIICAFPCVPKLRSLELWIWDLVSTKENAEERTKLLKMIGDACPQLERLSFQTRSFDYGNGGMTLRVVGETVFDWKDMIPALPHFPLLEELRLPGTLYTKDEQQTLMLERIGSSGPPKCEEGLFSPLKKLLFAPSPVPITPHTAAVSSDCHDRVEARERETSAILIHSASRLKKVSWVREEGAMVGVDYELADDGEVRLAANSPKVAEEFLGYFHDHEL